MGKQGIGEHAVCNQPASCAAILSCQIVTNDAKIVFGYVRELWAAGAFSNGPDVRRTRLQPPVHANVTTTVQPNPGLLKSNSGGIRNTPSRDQDVAAFDVVLARGRAHGKAHVLSRFPTYLEELGFQENLNTFLAQNPLHLVRDVDILPTHKSRAALDDCHVATEATVSLCHFETGITPTDHNQ